MQPPCAARPRWIRCRLSSLFAPDAVCSQAPKLVDAMHPRHPALPKSAARPGVEWGPEEGAASGGGAERWAPCGRTTLRLWSSGRLAGGRLWSGETKEGETIWSAAWDERRGAKGWAGERGRGRAKGERRGARAGKRGLTRATQGDAGCGKREKEDRSAMRRAGKGRAGHRRRDGGRKKKEPGRRGWDAGGKGITGAGVPLCRFSKKRRRAMCGGRIGSSGGER